MKKIVMPLLVAALTLGTVIAFAVGILNPVANDPALAYSKRYTINLQNAGVNTVTATAVYSSATLASQSFTTGQVSTGSFLVVDNTILASAKATNAITVTSTSGANGDSIVITQLQKPGAYVFLAGRDWKYGATTALTAASIKLALDKVPFISTSRSGAILYSTATTLGTAANSIIVQTNASDTLTVSSPTFLGGRNASTIWVNGYSFTAGTNYTVGASAALTATAIAAAINAKSTLKDQIDADTATSSVTLVSVKAGSLWNSTLATSNSSAISVLHPTMVGGATPSWTLSSRNISIASHAFTLALPVLYSTGTGAAAISGLTNQTTYYVIPVDANTVKLATSAAQALLLNGVVLASTSTLTAAKTYTLAPLAFTAAATTGGKWQVSNDASSWSDVSASSVSWVGGGGAGTTNWSLGLIPYKYLSFNVVGPATGGLNLNVTAFGTYTTP